MATQEPAKLIDLARKTLGLIDRHNRARMLLLLVLTVLAALLEVVSIGAVLPLFQMMLDPGWIRRFELVRAIVGDRTSGEYMLMVCGAVVVLFAAKIATSLSASWLKLDLQSRIYQQLSTRLHSAYMNSPLPFHLRHGSTELLRNVSSYVGQVGQYGFLGLVDLTSDTLLCFGVFCALVAVNPLIGTVALVSLGLVAWLYLLIAQPHFARWGQLYQVANLSMYRAALEPLIGIKTIKVLGREPYFEDRYRKNTKEFCNLQRNNAFSALIPRQLLELVAVGALVVSIGWAVLQGQEPAALLPVLAVFAAAAYRIMPSIVRIVAALQGLRFGRVAIEIVYADIMRAEGNAVRAAARARQVSTTGDIQINDASFRYEGAESTTLDRVNLQIKRGEAVAFVGMSGAGKTTLADLILGLQRPDSGTLTVGGTTYKDAAEVPRGVFSYVPQDPFLMDDTIRRNIALGISDNEIDENRLRTVIAIAALEDFIAKLPEGLETVVGERGVRLSGGQRQRIGIARALYVDPDALVLDEATSAVDMTTEAEITEAINRLRGSKTLIVIAHRLTTIRECDKIFYLDGGRVVACGSYDELIGMNAQFAAMVRQMSHLAVLPEAS